ncbi:hypothetical protein SAMN05421841_0693 [Chryseobacterium wanjuense]|uniref:MepB protein n=1 Tax=Chryseobacterium wanjuense TaxID=356305 RepID=A0A1I0NMZ0_9FLAO|nr:MepB family protein [Chryseobacterium wanjuense]SEW02679.1 hypothetical protein SAMN05421841_0693 [Chryseobacterium wanjuense]
MIEELKRIENLILKAKGHKILNLTEDLECKEYFGFNFQAGQLTIKFRKAKITPKKVGHFVTLWKRNAEKVTEPFNINDHFDFYLVFTEYENDMGFFLFPKQILMERQILSTDQKEGKRGFRVYPKWTKTENKQAEKTQSWQIKYFIDLANSELKNVEKFNSILLI